MRRKDAAAPRFVVRAIALAAGFLVGAPAVAQVPAEFADLFALLDGQLTEFDRSLDARSDGSRPPVSFGGELLTANGNRGRALLAPQALNGVRLELDRLRTLGLDSVTVAVPYPLLDPPFMVWSGRPGEERLFAAFFAAVVSEAHVRGMQAVIESGPMFPEVYSGGSGLDPGGYYATLSASEYAAGRAAQVAVIARDVRPDLLGVGSEPDTEVTLTGQTVLRSPAAFAAMVRGFVNQVAAVGAGAVPIVSGTGSWAHNGRDYVEALCAIEGLWGIDIHVYPVNLDFLDRALALADTANARGKRVVVLETWLQKERDGELGELQAAFDPTLFARDAFSFWAPLDQRFLAIMVKLARVARMAVLSPFWTRYFFAYLDYDGVSATVPPPTAAEIIAAATSAHAQALVGGSVSGTGIAYARLIADPRLRLRVGVRE